MFSPRDVYLEDYGSLVYNIAVLYACSIKLKPRLKQTEKLHSKVNASRESFNILLLDVYEQFTSKSVTLCFCVHVHTRSQKSTTTSICISQV